MIKVQKPVIRISRLLLAGLLALLLLAGSLGNISVFCGVAWADPDPPTVESTVPSANASGVLVNTTIEVTFSESMNVTATQYAFSIDPDVDGSFGWDTANTTVTYDPDEWLEYSTEYTVTISTDAMSSAGENLTPADYVWSFTTADLVDVTITDNGAEGLQFVAPGSGNVWSEAASPSITIENTGSVSVNISLKATDFTSGIDTITIDNAYYNDADSYATALAMSDEYNDLPWTLAPDETLNIYHWLVILGDTPTGTYTSTFTYKTNEAS